MFLAQCLWCRSACQAGRIIGKPVRGRRCPRNGKEGLAAASGHWERPREGAAVGNSHPPSPETSPARRTAFGSRVAITETCEARAEERRVGEEGVSTCRARGSPVM